MATINQDQKQKSYWFLSEFFLSGVLRALHCMSLAICFYFCWPFIKKYTEKSIWNVSSFWQLIKNLHKLIIVLLCLRERELQFNVVCQMHTITATPIFLMQKTHTQKRFSKIVCRCRDLRRNCKCYEFTH